jgi:DNA-binding LacI/PurR family transcriptional regulator
MRARLSDIAAQAGVSEATVSRVLNDKRGVSAETRQAVLAALDVLGHERPARLRRRSAGLVGLVVPELDNPIFPAFAQVIESGLAQQGFTPVLCTRTVGGASEAEYLELLLQHQVSGIILAGGLYAQAEAAHDHYARLAERRLPTVLVNASIDGIDFPRVSCDDVVAIEQAFGHLTALGHEQIGLVLGPTDHVPSRRKLAAFLAAGGSEGSVEHTIFTMEGGESGATRLVRRGVTGIICASDVLALGSIRGARRAGLGVPDDVSVIGFDDSALMSCTDPPLTTVRQPIVAMGRAAVDLLVGQIDGTSVPARELLFEPELVVRASTAAGVRGRKRGRQRTVAIKTETHAE